MLFNAKSFLYRYIKYIWFGLVWFLWDINHSRFSNAKSFLYIYTKYIWFALVLCHINHCMLFNAKSFCTYISNIYDLFWFGFYGISTIVCFLMPNLFFFVQIYQIYMIWFGLVWFHSISTIAGCQILLYVYIKYIISTHIFLITFSNEPEVNFSLSKMGSLISI